MKKIVVLSLASLSSIGHAVPVERVFVLSQAEYAFGVKVHAPARDSFRITAQFALESGLEILPPTRRPYAAELSESDLEVQRFIEDLRAILGSSTRVERVPIESIQLATQGGGRPGIGK